MGWYSIAAAGALGLIYALIRAYGHAIVKKSEREKQELAKWQNELEKQAHEIRRLRKFYK